MFVPTVVCGHGAHNHIEVQGESVEPRVADLHETGDRLVLSSVRGGFLGTVSHIKNERMIINATCEKLLLGRAM